MSNRASGFRSATGHVASVFVLRCTALLAVVLWLFPVCTHPGDEALTAVRPASASVSASASASTVDTARPAPGLGDVCPDLGHRDARCRAVTVVVGGTVSPAQAPSTKPLESGSGTAAQGAMAGPDAPQVRQPPPDLHQLRVQRI
ncbi:hypothetical protein ACFVT5_16515 [Streptomyces sp. NPDC058001]|uniref:hypothetical protein n=1 Tax=Streptomyces sp. NPDC058001 TaxID=3346300 RepID=UPI0036E3D844